MKAVSRVFPLLLLVVLALGMVMPAASQEMMSYSAPDCEYGGEFSSIEAVDTLTVKFTLCAPDPAFPSKVAFSSYAIQSSEHLEATGGGGEALFRNPVGTGPYMLSNWTVGEEIVLTRNDNYWGEPAIEPTAIIRWNSEASARLVELQAGTVDGIDNPAPGDFEVIEGDSNLALYKRSGTNVFYLGINNRVAPFDNQLVRQAISYAIDKERIVANFYPAGSSVATQFIPPSIFGYTAETEPFPYDPEMARQLLAESGVTLPIETTLSYRNVVRGYLPNPPIVAQDLQAQLAEVGINVTIEEMESGAFLDAADRGELSLHLLGWGADYPDATNFLDFHFGGGSSDQFGDKNPEITSLLSQAASLSDPEERLAIYAQANALIRDWVPMLPVAHGGNGAAFKASIVGAYASDIGAEQFALMEDPADDNIVWMQNGEPAGLYCADETDGEALRVCEQINESLLSYEVGTGKPIPRLATEYTANEDLTEWTFTLRDGVNFTDGTTLDANDVVLSYAVQWDAAHPLHIGRDGSFTYFPGLFGQFLNAPPSE
jgi:ABC-type transport system substrate-binding protein